MASAADSLDTRGLICPLPALKARKRLAGMAPGQILEMWADDPAAQSDIPELCHSAGHRLAASEPASDDSGDLYRFRIEAWGATEGPATASDHGAEPM